MIAEEDLVDVRCRGCFQHLGVGPNRPFHIFCDLDCAEDYPATINEGRDALMEAIFQTVTITKADLASYFGVTRQRCEQIISRRVIS